MSQGLHAREVRSAIDDAKKESLDEYQYQETRELVRLVKDAADLVRLKGQAAFADFRVAGSRWRHDERYIFVLDPTGNMRVHPDPAMEGKAERDLKDINGKPIILGLVGAATSIPGKPAGWYHYQWPVPGGILPRWKSTYVQLTTAPSGERYIVGSGMYNDRMERSFVVDAVIDAVGEIERNGGAAFRLFRDPTSRFLAKDAYIFVVDMDGAELVNPAFPNLEGRNIRDLKDSQGKALVREMLKTAETSGSGWVDYMWPKPGESVSTLKSAYVSTAKMGEKRLLVGCGVYLADAPKAIAATRKMTAPLLMVHLREGAALLEKKGEKAYSEFRAKGSKWASDDSYVFVRDMDQTIVFHPADPTQEGRNMSGVTDVLGRPYGKMFHEAATSPAGEGWVHYMYPEPGNIFPIWKSTFVKRVTFPSGKQHIVCCGIYNMAMDEGFIVDVVNRAAALVAERGKEAFGALRDKTGPYVFLDTYVFVDDIDGTELVNPAQPSLEGKDLSDMRDVNGKLVVREYVRAAMKDGSAWVDYYWYKPGHNTPARKHSYVRKVQFGKSTYIVGSGFYPPDGETGAGQIRKVAWHAVQKERLSDSLTRQTIFGEKGTMARLSAKRGGVVARHSHISEEYSWVTSGALRFVFDDRSIEAAPGEVVVIPPNVPHSVVALKDATFVDFFAPVREDWLRGEDQYLRR